MYKRLLGSFGLSCVAAASTVVAVLSACTTDYQKGLDDVNYGPPNALAGTKTPGGSDEFVTGGDGGVVTGSSSGGTQPLCQKNGGTPLGDAGTCAVSFKTDILGILGNAGCAQSSDCHGGTNPKYQPRIEPSDGPGTWAVLAGFQLSDGKPYINPCSTDKTKAGMGCNLASTGVCGTKMPLGGTPVAAGDLAKIETWLGCGSPNN